jgi:hypothetical protein
MEQRWWLTPAPDAGAMTVGGELNKLASHVAVGRNIAGVHWRSDYTESLKLGETVAIGVLFDQKVTYVEDFIRCRPPHVGVCFAL